MSITNNKFKDDIGKYLYSAILDSLIPNWYGTLWAFYGNTEMPRSGTIACGYFVTTILKHAGFNIDREQLAKCPSEKMIKAVISVNKIIRTSNLPFERFVKLINLNKDGLYVIGLDNHTGFISVKSGKVYFIHSKGKFPFMVIKQRIEESSEIVNSKYRVLGSLLDDEKLIQSWLNNSKLKFENI